MNPRGTLFMLVLLAGLGAFWYFHDVQGAKVREEAKEKEERLFPGLEAGDLQSLRLVDSKNSDGPALLIEKVGRRWVIRGERDLLASQDDLSSLTDQLASLRRVSVISETPAEQDLAQYALDKPRRRLELGTSKGAYTLLLGDRTPDDRSYYVRSSQTGPVLEVDSVFMTILEKPIQDLREKSPLPLEPSTVERLVIQPEQGPEIVLVKEPSKETGGETSALGISERWRLESPIQAQADPRKVSEFLWSWKSLVAGRFLGPSEKTDFSKPVMTLTAWNPGDSAPLKLELGPRVQVKPGLAYVRRSDPQEVLVVDLVDREEQLLGHTAEDFVDRHLLDFAEDQVDRIEATLGQEKLLARRIRDGWEVREPADVVKDESTRNSAVSNLLFDALDLQWASRAADGAPDSLIAPRATLRFLDKTGEVLGTLLIGSPRDGGGVWAANQSSGPFFVLEKDPLEKMRVGLARLKGSSPSASASPVGPPLEP
jgi:hypothetical protein